MIHPTPHSPPNPHVTRPPPIEAVRVHGKVTACMVRSSDDATPECVYFRDGVHLLGGEGGESDAAASVAGAHSTATLLDLGSCLCVVNGIRGSLAGTGLQAVAANMLTTLLQTRLESAKVVRMCISVRALRHHNTGDGDVEDILSGHSQGLNSTLISSSLKRMEVETSDDVQTLVARLAQTVRGTTPGNAVAVVVLELRTARSRRGQEAPFSPDTFYPTVGTRVYLVEAPPSRADVLRLMASRSPRAQEINNTGLVSLLQPVVMRPRNLVTVVARVEDTLEQRTNTLSVLQFTRLFHPNVMLSAVAGSSPKDASPTNRRSPLNRFDETAWARLSSRGSQTRQQRQPSEVFATPSANKKRKGKKPGITLHQLEMAEAEAANKVVAASKQAGWGERPRGVMFVPHEQVARIQALLRGVQTRSALLAASNAVTLLRACFRKMRALVNDFAEQAMGFDATCALVEMTSVRKGRRFARLFKQVQATKKRWLEEKDAAKTNQAKSAAATTIQNAHRSRQARDETRRRRVKAEANDKAYKKLLEEEKEWLANSLQSTFRGATTRKDMAIFKNVAGLLLAGVTGPEFSRPLKQLPVSLMNLVDPRLQMPLLHYAVHSKAPESTLDALCTRKADVNLTTGDNHITPLLLALQVPECNERVLVVLVVVFLGVG